MKAGQYLQQILHILPQREFTEEELKQELKGFERYLILNDSIKKITIKSHLGDISRMLRNMRTLDPILYDVESYVLRLKKSEMSYNHIANNLVSIEKYLKFKGGEIHFARPKKPKRLIKDFLTEGEVFLLIHTAKNIRELAIISLLSYSGLRNSELCNLKVEDMDFGNNTIQVINGKNSKDSIRYMSAECTRILLKYLSKFPREEDDYLFTSLVYNNKYCPSDLRKLIRVLSKRAKIKRRVYPHMLRHSLASNLLNRGANLILIQNVLGHNDISSTIIYAHSCPQRTKSEYELYKPAYM
jgi:integrase/recombinase XerD